MRPKGETNLVTLATDGDVYIGDSFFETRCQGLSLARCFDSLTEMSKFDRQEPF
jgi:hypothetical protein